MASHSRDDRKSGSCVRPLGLGEIVMYHDAQRLAEDLRVEGAAVGRHGLNEAMAALGRFGVKECCAQPFWNRPMGGCLAGARGDDEG